MSIWMWICIYTWICCACVSVKEPGGLLRNRTCHVMCSFAFHRTIVRLSLKGANAVVEQITCTHKSPTAAMHEFFRAYICACGLVWEGEGARDRKTLCVWILTDLKVELRRCTFATVCHINVHTPHTQNTQKQVKHTACMCIRNRLWHTHTSTHRHCYTYTRAHMQLHKISHAATRVQVCNNNHTQNQSDYARSNKNTEPMPPSVYLKDSTKHAPASLCLWMLDIRTSVLIVHTCIHHARA